MDLLDIVSDYRAALVDLDSGIGVAVEMPPASDCATRLTSWWTDRVEFEAELLVFDAAVAHLLPDAQGRLTAMHLGPCVAWDDDGHEVALWSPDALPIHEDGAGAV